jgi:hypothetical protein
MKDANRILEQAEEVAASAETWADLSNALFDPVNGLITRAYPTREEREEFLKTKQTIQENPCASHPSHQYARAGRGCYA